MGHPHRLAPVTRTLALIGLSIGCACSADDERFKGFKSQVKVQPVQSFWCYTLDIGIAIKENEIGENTGIGIWTEEMFVQAMRTGKHMGQSRPIMPPGRLIPAKARVFVDEIAKSISTRTGGSGFGLAEAIYRQMADNLKAVPLAPTESLQIGPQPGEEE